MLYSTHSKAKQQTAVMKIDFLHIRLAALRPAIGATLPLCSPDSRILSQTKFTICLVHDTIFVYDHDARCLLQCRYGLRSFAHIMQAAKFWKIKAVEQNVTRRTRTKANAGRVCCLTAKYARQPWLYLYSARLHGRTPLCSMCSL